MSQVIVERLDALLVPSSINTSFLEHGFLRYKNSLESLSDPTLDPEYSLQLLGAARAYTIFGGQLASVAQQFYETHKHPKMNKPRFENMKPVVVNAITPHLRKDQIESLIADANNSIPLYATPHIRNLLYVDGQLLVARYALTPLDASLRDTAQDQSLLVRVWRREIKEFFEEIRALRD